MTNKSRLKRLEAKQKPNLKVIPIFEDPHNPGEFYTTMNPKEGKRLTEADIKTLGSEPGAVILQVQYDRKDPAN